jgi:hypothetical protein
MDFVDHMIGSGRVDELARMLGVAEHDPVDWVAWTRFRARSITVLGVKRVGDGVIPCVLLVETQFSERGRHREENKES